jgi:hypothetical protein
MQRGRLQGTAAGRGRIRFDALLLSSWLTW